MKLRTGAKAAAVLRLDGGAVAALGPDTSVFLPVIGGGIDVLRLSLGVLEISSNGEREFRLLTAAASASFRKAAFRVRADARGNADFDSYAEPLGLEDNRGQHILLRAQDSVRSGPNGFSGFRKFSTKSESDRRRRKESLDAERRNESRRAARTAGAIESLRRFELESGKALIDKEGRRVRSEAYVLRPTAKSFQLVELTARGGEMGTFYYLGSFNRGLPDDLGSVWNLLNGALDSEPNLYLSSYEAVRSNGIDSVHERGEGGHLVNLNSNADANDDLDSFFDPARGSFVNAVGRGVFRPLFDRYGLYVNGKLKHGWSGNSIQSAAEGLAARSTTTDPFSGAALSATNASVDSNGFLATRSVAVSYPDPFRMHQSVLESYGDGSELTSNRFMIDSWSGAASTDQFGGEQSGNGVKTRALDFYDQQVLGATEFSGRKIDLLLSVRFQAAAGRLR